MKKKKKSNWLYVATKNNQYRYIIGEKGVGKTLICIGINPSTATPAKLDHTTTVVKNYANLKSYGTWIMLNIYPYRSTNPSHIENHFNDQAHESNMSHIRKILEAYPDADIWLAFGNNIFIRDYLINCTKDILSELKHYPNPVFSRGEITSLGIPHHPIGVSYDEPLQPFNISKLLKNI